MKKSIIFFTSGDKGRSGFVNPDKTMVNSHTRSFMYGLNKNGYRIYQLLFPKILLFPFLLWRYKPKFIISTPHPISIFITFWKCIGLLKKKYVVYWDDLYPEMMGRKYSPQLVSYLELLSVRLSDFIVTPSKLLEGVSKTLGKKAMFVPHGVDPKELNKVKLIHLPNKFKVGYVGSINHYKRSDVLIDLAKKNKNVLFYVIGHVGEYKKRLEKLPNIHLLDYLPPEVFFQYIKACDLALITADQDSTIKMYYYMGLGVPILAYQGRASYVFEDNKTAILRSNLDKGLKFALNNPQVLKNIKNNYKKIKIKDWPEIAKNIIDRLKKEKVIYDK